MRCVDIIHSVRQHAFKSNENVDVLFRMVLVLGETKTLIVISGLHGHISLKVSVSCINDVLFKGLFG